MRRAAFSQSGRQLRSVIPHLCHSSAATLTRCIQPWSHLQAVYHPSCQSYL